MLKNVLLQATSAGAQLVKEYFDRPFTISNKEGINNLVTEADHASEKVIIEVIRKNFPDHSILSEEVGEIKMDSSLRENHVKRKELDSGLTSSAAESRRNDEQRAKTSKRQEWPIHDSDRPRDKSVSGRLGRD